MSLEPNWQLEGLWQALQALSPELSVEWVPETGSTNSLLLDRARRGDATPCLLVANAQTAGRGRLGRSWWAAPGASLTFSLGLPYAPVDWSGLSLAVGLAVAEALDPANTHIGLKWPNDLWLRHGERKLGGILIETTALAADSEAGSEDTVMGRRFVVIGVGLNISNGPGDDAALRGQFSSGHAGLQTLDPALDGPAVLHRIAVPLLRAVQRFETDGLAALQTRYQARDVLQGREVQAGETRGRAVGIDRQGQLLVETAQCLASIGSGEVSVRPC